MRMRDNKSNFFILKYLTAELRIKGKKTYTLENYKRCRNKAHNEHHNGKVANYFPSPVEWSIVINWWMFYFNNKK